MSGVCREHKWMDEKIEEVQGKKKRTIFLNDMTCKEEVTSMDVCLFDVESVLDSYLRTWQKDYVRNMIREMNGEKRNS